MEGVPCVCLRIVLDRTTVGQYILSRPLPPLRIKIHTHSTPTALRIKIHTHSNLEDPAWDQKDFVVPKSFPT